MSGPEQNRALTSGARRFEGRVAVVTGGTTGIGLAIVQRLHAEGATVVFCGRRPDVGAEALATLDLDGASNQAEFVAADVTRREDLEALHATAVERHGRLDVVVNNAGNVVVGPLLKLKPEHWRRTIALNLDSAFDSCQLAIPHLRATLAAHPEPLAGSPHPRTAAIVNVERVRLQRGRIASRSSPIEYRFSPPCPRLPTSAATTTAGTTQPGAPATSPPTNESGSKSTTETKAPISVGTVSPTTSPRAVAPTTCAGVCRSGETYRVQSPVSVT